MGVEDIIHSPSPAEAGHIDGMLNIVDRKKAIFNPVQLSYGTWRAMVDRGYEMIAVPSDEALNNASTNTVALRPGLVIHPTGNPRTTQLMQEHGIEVINIDFDEIFKGNGAVHCCTATLKRGN